MKFLSCMLALFCATAALAKSDAGLFHETLRESIKQDMTKDPENYRQAPTRSPASAPSPSAEFQEQGKSLDKLEKNYKQLGRPSW